MPSGNFVERTPFYVFVLSEFSYWFSVWKIAERNSCLLANLCHPILFVTTTVEPILCSIVGGTAFVLTGVIGDSSSRDGHRQSRILSGTDEGFELFTVDHDDASLRLDLRGSWNMNDVPKYLVPEDVLLCDPSNGWLCSKVDCDVSTGGADMDNGISPLPGPPTATWFNISATAMLTLQDEVSFFVCHFHFNSGNKNVFDCNDLTKNTCSSMFLVTIDLSCVTGACGVRCCHHGSHWSCLH